MDYETVLGAAKILINEHPVWYTIVVSGFSALGGGKLLPWLQTKGVDWVVNKASDWQESRERKAGLSPLQMAVLAQHEADIAQRAADDLKRRAAALQANLGTPTSDAK